MNKLQRTKIVDLLQSEDFGSLVQVKGWIRTRRGNKQVGFIALNDGSTIHNIQIVVELASFDEELLKQLTTGACIRVDGILRNRRLRVKKRRFRPKRSKCTALPIPILILCKRKVIPWNF
ncbi:MAG TPA: OB-fold nucleic acid binding domain-containing protein [Bacteroidales bacterium]|nr:OB-fold nucleic acid binding domain-containing protein [Bacteroidales bacterium]